MTLRSFTDRRTKMELSNTELMEQAASTAGYYLSEALTRVEKLELSSVEKTQLASAFMVAAALDYLATSRNA
jgi:hypothetical protein